jgi:hypothetical protein
MQVAGVLPNSWGAEWLRFKGKCREDGKSGKESVSPFLYFFPSSFRTSRLTGPYYFFGTTTNI